MDEANKETVAPLQNESVAPEIKKEFSGLETFAKDFGATLSGERGDIIRRAIKEEEMKEAAKKAQTLSSRTNVFMLVGSVLALVVGLGLIIYFAMHAGTKTVEPMKNTQVPSLIGAEASTEISITSVPKDKLLAAIALARAKELSDGTVENIFFTDMRAGVRYLSSGKAFLSALGSNAPALLTDTLQSPMMFGVYTEQKTHLPFLILKVTSYNDAFAGMKEWEGRLFDDLYQPFGISIQGDNSSLFEATFSDAIFSNKNARVLRNSAQEVSLLYAFADDSTIVIATSPDTLKEILARMTSQKIEQGS